MTPLSVTAFTDTGSVRARNEDAVLVGGWLCQTAVGSMVTIEMQAELPVVVAVADGMGGHAGGDLASRIALGVIAEVSPGWRSADDVVAGLQQANERVYRVGQNPDLHGLGTTIAGVCVLDRQVIAFNVGDSRIYTLRDGFLQQISIDDAVLDVTGRPSSTLTQSIGQRTPVDPHLVVLPRDGTGALLCSDGVSGMLTAAELRSAAMKADTLQIAESITVATRQSGAEDNFSFAIVTVPMSTHPGGTS